MVARVLVIAAIAAAANATDGTADSVDTLSMENAVHLTVSSHPILLQAAIDVGSAELRVKQARSRKAPQVDAGGLTNAGLTGSANLFGLHGLASSPEPQNGSFSINLFQDLLDFRRTKHESEARRAEVEHLEETLRAEQSRLILQARKAFLKALAATRRVEAAERAVEEGALGVRSALARHRAGLAAKLEVSEAETDLAQARLRRASARAALGRSLARLNSGMGRESNRTYALQEPPVEAAVPDRIEFLLASAMESRPELRAVDARIRAAEHWVERAEREKLPRIMGMFSGGWTRFSELTLGRLLFGAFGIHLPLFTGGRIQATIEETRLALEKTKAAREVLARSIPLEVTEAHEELSAALEGLRTGDQAHLHASTVERQERVRKKHGLADGLDLARARTALAEASSARARARYRYKVAEAELDFATGKAVAN